MTRWLAIAAQLAWIATAQAVAITAVQGGDSAQDERRETRSRLPRERMEALVAGPMARVRRGDMAGAERAFETLHDGVARRHGPGSVQAADLLMSFGAMLYNEGPGSSETRAGRSVLYLRRAVEATRRAFGPDHPEVALALHSLADVLVEVAPNDPPAEAETALEDAYRIRLAAFGVANPETLAALGALAHIRGLPARTRGDPARIAAVAAMYRQGLAEARRATGQFPEQQPDLWRLRLARLYIRNGQPAAALAIIDEAAREAGGDCMETIPLVLGIANLLTEAGLEAQAERLQERFAIEQAGPCPSVAAVT